METYESRTIYGFPSSPTVHDALLEGAAGGTAPPHVESRRPRPPVILPIVLSTAPPPCRVVGYGVAKSDCGQFIQVLDCPNRHVHDCFKAHRCSPVRPVPKHCGRPECPTCCRSWAWRRAGEMADKLLAVYYAHRKKKSKLGLPKHVCVSQRPDTYPEAEWNKPKFRAKRKAEARRWLESVGFVGGNLLYHPRRDDGVFSPHFHSVGFGWIDGNKVSALHKAKGCVIKNMSKGKRKLSLNKDVLMRAFAYELGHAGFFAGGQVSSYFGLLANNMAIKVGVKVSTVPLMCACGHQLERWNFDHSRCAGPAYAIRKTSFFEIKPPPAAGK